MPSTPNPKVSVLMTVYNGEAFIQETLDSIFAQTFEDFELVVVNNGCTDSTPDILAAIDDPRLRVVHPEKHGTVGDGLRFGYKQLRGDYIAVHDADDLSSPDRFARQVAVFEAVPLAGLVCSDYQKIDVHGAVLETIEMPRTRQELLDVMQATNPFAHSSCMFRKTATDTFGGYPDDFVYSSDFGIILGVFEYDWQVICLDQPLFQHRIHPGQASIAPELLCTRLEEAIELLARANKLDGVSWNGRRAARHARVKLYLQYAFATLSTGQTGKGLAWIFKGIANQPLYAAAYLGYRSACRIGLMKPRGN